MPAAAAMPPSSPPLASPLPVRCSPATTTPASKRCSTSCLNAARSEQLTFADATVFEAHATRSELLCQTVRVIDDDDERAARALLDQSVLQMLCARAVEPRP